MEDEEVRPHILVLLAARPHPPQPHVLVLQGEAPRPLKFYSFFSFFSVLGLFWRKWQDTIFIFSPQFSFKINLIFSDRIPLTFRQPRYWQFWPNWQNTPNFKNSYSYSDLEKLKNSDLGCFLFVVHDPFNRPKAKNKIIFFCLKKKYKKHDFSFQSGPNLMSFALRGGYGAKNLKFCREILALALQGVFSPAAIRREKKVFCSHAPRAVFTHISELIASN